MRAFLKELFAPFREPVCIAPIAAAEAQEAKRKRNWKPSSAEPYLDKSNGSQVAVIIRALAKGYPLTTLDLKKRLLFAGHVVNDMGHRISNAREALSRSGIVLHGQSVALRSGKRCHQYHLSAAGIAKLEHLQAVGK